jgi:hypothetical protein
MSSKIENLILREIRDIKTEQKKHYKLISRVLNEHEETEERIVKLEKMHGDCLLASHTAKTFIDFGISRFDDLKDVLDEFASRKENIKNTKKEFRVRLVTYVTGMIVILIFFLLSKWDEVLKLITPH